MYTSGNRSKKWNKFDVWAMMLAGLPRADNSQIETSTLFAAQMRLQHLKWQNRL